MIRNFPIPDQTLKLVQNPDVQVGGISGGKILPITWVRLYVQLAVGNPCKYKCGKLTTTQLVREAA